MSFVPIANKCNEPLEAAHVSIEDDRYGVAEYGAPKFDLSDQLPYDVVESLLRKLSF